MLVDLCKRTAPLPHPLPKSQLQSANPILRLHFIDGQFTVAPEVVEASLGPHMQVRNHYNMFKVNVFSTLENLCKAKFGSLPILIDSFSPYCMPNILLTICGFIITEFAPPSRC